MASLEWNIVGLNLSSSPLQPAGSSSGGSSSNSSSSLSATMDIIVAEGYVLSTSLLSPTPQTIPLVGTSTSNITTVVATASGQQLTVQLQNLYWQLQSICESCGWVGGSLGGWMGG